MMVISDIPLASQNQFAWMQSGELHMTMGKSSNAASVPLDTRYVSPLQYSAPFQISLIYIDVCLYPGITKKQIRMRLRLCQPIAPVQVPVTLNKHHKIRQNLINMPTLLEFFN